MDEEFEHFVAVSGRRLLATAALLTQHRQQAEDLVQATLLKTWGSWGEVHTSHEAFARRVMVNTYITWWRRRWNGERPTEELPEVATTESDSSASLDLRAALARLPRRQRTVVVLRYFEDLTESEVATLMGCSVGTVKSQASKALAKLGVDPALTHDSAEVSR